MGRSTAPFYEFKSKYGGQKVSEGLNKTVSPSASTLTLPSGLILRTSSDCGPTATWV
ncbi:hypothetical protein ANTHELSMS3_00095 [Antarctobacter heliothermus]|uniref:Uncharacterized protein n=1 Tax=Antarctobacter heliothermus TaxID=74033 RepID=A0A222DYN8_9RHOB|nr:hypothetical protein ANTHELSMS3_00095 [Antarctobacter heliothermus]